MENTDPLVNLFCLSTVTIDCKEWVNSWAVVPPSLTALGWHQKAPIIPSAVPPLAQP